MRKAIWLLIGVVALLTINATAALAIPCPPDQLLVNGKADFEVACAVGGGTVEVKVSSSVPSACVLVECGVIRGVDSVFALVLGADCTGSATPDTDGDAHTKTVCKGGDNNTKIEITLDSCTRVTLACD